MPLGCALPVGNSGLWGGRRGVCGSGPVGAAAPPRSCCDHRCAACVSRRGRSGGFGEHCSPPAEPAGHAGPAVDRRSHRDSSDATLHKLSDAPPHPAGLLYTERTTRGCPCRYANCSKPGVSVDFRLLRIILESLSHHSFRTTGSFSMSRSDYGMSPRLQRFRHLNSLTSPAGQRTEFFTADSPNGSFIGTTHFGRV